ncbi:YidH family protein [Amycolatopsis magusensis]|uniref:YidH family protein n=1 Tax=Amycolatopsis magusensis TaxID=882444 RepID=UPI0037B57A03
MTESPGKHEEQEPDYRFSLANERTFLAWMRTALGLLAGAVAVRQLVPEFGVPGARTILALLCAALAVLLTAASYPRWRRVQRAMRRGEPLPPNRMMLLLTAGLAVITALAVVLVVTG